MKMFRRQIIAALGLLLILPWAHAESLYMTRTQQSFPEAMSKLQETIRSTGYSVSRVQRVDIGLTKSGYQTDKYRVVFFGKQEEVSVITAKYPHLIPYVPWKIAIFAEGEDTLLVTANPMKFTNDNFPEANQYLKKWDNDIQNILATMRKSELD